MCKLTSKVDGIDLFLAEYCAYCPDFTAEVDKTDITVMADKYEKNQVTIRCRNESKCARLYERARREAECNNDGTR